MKPNGGFRYYYALPDTTKVMAHNRLDPSDMTSEALRELSEVLTGPGKAALVDSEGRHVELPAPLFGHLVRIVHLMAQGRPIVLLPEDEECTTQAAADFLGVSRQHLVDLLEQGDIPFHKVGTHRRVYLRDLLAYQKERDSKRRSALDRLSQAVDDEGLYDASYTGDE